MIILYNITIDLIIFNLLKYDIINFNNKLRSIEYV